MSSDAMAQMMKGMGDIPGGSPTEQPSKLNSNEKLPDAKVKAKSSDLLNNVVGSVIDSISDVVKIFNPFSWFSSIF